MPRAHHRLPLALCLGLLACRTPSSRIPIDELAEKDEARERTGEAHEQLEPLPVKTPTDLLPAEVPVMAEALDPAAVLANIRALDKFPQFQSLRSEMVSAIGIDLLDAEAWQRIGIDRHGAVGIALLDIEAEGFVAYATVSDPRALGDFIEGLADRVGQRDELSSAEVGRALVYRFGDELSVVMREGVAMLVFVEHPDRAPRDFVATIATIDPREALSHSKTFMWAREQVDVADDGLIFVDPADLVAQIEREMVGTDSDYGVRYAQDALDSARQRGEPVEQIRELEKRLEEERKWQREREVREAGERELVRSLFGPIEAFVAAGELRGDSISGHARMLVPGDGLLARLFVPTDAESPLLRALDEPPLVAVDGRADMQVLLQLVDLMARSEGESLQEVSSEIRDHTGIDPLVDVVPLLTGTGGFMLTQTHELTTKNMYDAKKNLGLAAYVEVTDPDRVRSMLDALMRSKRVPELGRAKRGDGWVLSVPEWHDVALALVGNRLVASTDTKLADRIRDARPGSQADALADPGHPLRGSAPTPALRMYQRFTWLAAESAYASPERDVESMLYDINSHHTLTPEQAATVPRSREFKKKLGELEKALADLDAFDRRQSQRRYEQEIELARSFGDVGMQIERLPDGLGARGLWRMAPGTTPLEVWLRAFMVGDMSTDWTEYDRLSQDVGRVREELMVIRRADLDAAAAKLPK